jgi:DNA-directed RNA polymerase beta subunit
MNTKKLQLNKKLIISVKFLTSKTMLSTKQTETKASQSIVLEDSQTRIVVPPPIIRLSSTLDRQDLKPGIVESTRSEKMMKTALQYNPAAAGVISGMNNFINNIPDQMNSRPIMHPDGMVVVTEVQCPKPSYSDGNENYPMTPSYAINNQLNYNFQIRVKFAIRMHNVQKQSGLSSAKGKKQNTESRLNQIDHSKYEGLIPVSKDFIACGEIPCVIGSKTCNLTDIEGNPVSEEERAKLGFCENDLYGYTIIGGNKVAVILQEVLRKNMPIIMMSDDIKDHVIRLTSRASSGSTYVVTVFQQNNILYLDTSVLRKDKEKKYNLNLFSAFRLLGLDDADKVEELILSMMNAPVGSSYYQTAKQILAQTRAHDIYSLKMIFEEVLKNDSVMTLDDLYDKMINSIFPHIDKTTSVLDTEVSMRLRGDRGDAKSGRAEEKERKFNYEADKIHLAAYMTAYYLDFLSGFNPTPDDRDSWTIKALESAGTQYEKIFAGVWNYVACQIENNIYNKQLTPGNVFKEIGAVLANSFVFSRDFRRKFMGMKTYNSEGDNFAQFIKDDTLISPYVYLNKITPKIDENAKQSVRMVQSTQNGYVCYFATPENGRCGLVKFLAIGARISMSANLTSIVDQKMKELLSYDSRNGQIRYYFNYVFRGFGNEEPYMRLKKYRRENIIPVDTAIVYIRNNRTIHVLTSNNRLCRPLLVVDSEGKLEIDKPREITVAGETKTVNLWETDFRTMMNYGAIEYVDAWEESQLLVAQDMNTLYSKKMAYNDSLVQVEKLKSQIEKLTQAYEKVKRTEQTGELSEIISRFEKKIGELKTSLKEATNIQERLYEESNYSHCELDPTMNFSFHAALIPFPDHNPGPRNTFQCKMADQAIGRLNTRGANKLSKEYREMIYPERPIVETPLARMMGMDVAPTGHPVSFIIKTDAWNQEDSIKVNLDALEYGMFNYIQYSVYERELSFGEQLGHPNSILVAGEAKESKYDHLDENGLPKVGTLMKKGDVLLNIIKQKSWEGNMIKINTPFIVTAGREGRVDYVHRYLKTNDGNNKECIRIRLQYYGIPDMGDKFASRSAQKGTGSSYIRRYELPWTLIDRSVEVVKNGNTKYEYDYKTGTVSKTATPVGYEPKKLQYKFVPTIIMNPHSIPSRMTIGKIIEIISSSYGLSIGARISGAAFQKFKTDEFMKLIKDVGMKTAGMYVFKDPVTGRNDLSHVFAGTVHYNTLKHLIKDKIQSRSTGKVDPISKQPLGGRTREGGSGLKFGEMERDGIIGFGASGILHDKTCVSSDQIKILVCRNCKKYGNIYMKGKSYTCGLCEGKDITYTFMPHNFKVVTSVLQAVNVKLDIITE